MTSQLKQLMDAKAEREQRKLTPRTVVTETGVSWRKVYPMARGESFSVTDEDMERLCAYFDCTPGELFVVEDVT